MSLNDSSFCNERKARTTGRDEFMTRTEMVRCNGIVAEGKTRCQPCIDRAAKATEKAAARQAQRERIRQAGAR